MTTLIVLFNLKEGANAADYESWARNTDLPTVRALDSVAAFDAYRTQGLLGSEAAAPYQYVEVIQVPDMARFGEELATDVMQNVAAEFQQFADAPCFMLATALDS